MSDLKMGEVMKCVHCKGRGFCNDGKIACFQCCKAAGKTYGLIGLVQSAREKVLFGSVQTLSTFPPRYKDKSRHAFFLCLFCF